MIAWAAGTGIRPARVVDPGSGSARMLLAAGRRWPQAALVGVEIDPWPRSWAGPAWPRPGSPAGPRCCSATTATRLPPAGGPTLFLGNPPYVRHHQIAAPGKEWLRRTALEQGVPASGLAGLHAHFFLATAGHAVPGDLGVLITAAEWLDVNYGRLVRELLLGALGGQAVHLVEPTVPVFADATATSVITCFRPGTVPEAIRMRRVAGPADLGALAGGIPVPHGRPPRRLPVGAAAPPGRPRAAEPGRSRTGSAGPAAAALARPAPPGKPPGRPRRAG